MNWSLMLESVPALLYGALATVQLLLMTLVCGALLALPLGIVAANGRPIIRLPVMGYITFFRGTPLLVQVFLVYYGFSQFQIVRSSIFWPVLREAWFCALLTLALHTAAYREHPARRHSRNPGRSEGGGRRLGHAPLAHLPARYSSPGVAHRHAGLWQRNDQHDEGDLARQHNHDHGAHGHGKYHRRPNL